MISKRKGKLKKDIYYIFMKEHRSFIENSRKTLSFDVSREIFVLLIAELLL